MKNSSLCTILPGVFFATSALAGDGLPDTSFGSGSGHVTIPFAAGDGGIDDVADTIALADGDILVVGTTIATSRPTFTIARLDADGGTVQTYGTGGVAVIAPDGETRPMHARAAAVQDDGKLVVVGVVETDQSGLDGNLDVMVCQLLPDGTPDPQFGGVRTGYAGCEEYAFDRGGNLQDVPRDVITDPLGRIVVVGHSVCFGDRYSALAMRLTADGSFDTTFVGQDDSMNVVADGWSVFPDPDNLQEVYGASYAGVVRRPNGELIFAMERWNSAGPVELATQNNIVLWPAAQDGFSFVLHPFNFPGAEGRQSRIADLHIAGDRLLLAGSAEVAANMHAAAVLAVDVSNNYAEDPAFGTQGYFVDLLCECADTRIASMAVRDDGRILLASNATTNTTGMLATRLLASGAFDATFGNGGTAKVSITPDSTAESARGIALQGDQPIIAGQRLHNGSADWAVLRVTGNRMFRDGFE